MCDLKMLYFNIFDRKRFFQTFISTEYPVLLPVSESVTILKIQEPNLRSLVVKKTVFVLNENKSKLYKKLTAV